MADDQTSYDENEGDVPETGDSDVQTSTVVVPSADASSTPVVEGDDYDDDAPIEDYVVNLVVNEQPDGVTLSPDLVNAAITDINGNIIGNKPNLYDSLSTAVYDQLNNNNGTAVTGSKGLWGWSPLKLIIVGLLAVCILALILGILFFVFGKKFKKRGGQAAGSSASSKAAANKAASPEQKYQPVPNV